VVGLFIGPYTLCHLRLSPVYKREETCDKQRLRANAILYHNSDDVKYWYCDLTQLICYNYNVLAFLTTQIYRVNSVGITIFIIISLAECG